MKADITLETLVAIIIGIFVLLLLLYYLTVSSGGPLSIIKSVLSFMNRSSETLGNI